MSNTFKQVKLPLSKALKFGDYVVNTKEGINGRIVSVNREPSDVFPKGSICVELTEPVYSSRCKIIDVALPSFDVVVLLDDFNNMVKELLKKGLFNITELDDEAVIIANVDSQIICYKSSWDEAVELHKHN